MKSFTHSFEVKAGLDKVWEFYTDVRHLEIITPPEMRLEILSTTDERISEGAETWLSSKILLKTKWHSRIVSLKPYRYVDEMIISDTKNQLFKYWSHEHIFQGDDKHTIVIDNIRLKLPFGVFGRFFERYASAKLKKIFKYREAATRRYLEQS
jgi:ligand-binding SRPBCC domain-containing protein